MVLWFITYAMSPIIIIVCEVSIVIVYDVSLCYRLWCIKFKAVWGKTDYTDLWVMKPLSCGFGVPHCWRNSCTQLLRTLYEVEEAGWEDGGAEEAQEDAGADQVVGHVCLVTALTLLTQAPKHLTQLTDKTNTRFMLYIFFTFFSDLIKIMF